MVKTYNLINNRLKGVTLVEILVTLAIVSILIATITPTLSRYLPGIQLNGTTRDLTTNLREAQEKAITEQKQYLIRFSPLSSPAYYQMIRIDNGEEEIKRIDLPMYESLTLSQSITNNQIIFSADGGPSASGNITLSSTSASKVVSVSPAGFIKIEQ